MEEKISTEPDTRLESENISNDIGEEISILPTLGDLCESVGVMSDSATVATQVNMTSGGVSADMGLSRCDAAAATIDMSIIQLPKMSEGRIKKIEKNARLKEKRKKLKMEKLQSGKALTTDAGYSTENFTTSSYYFENGLRKVYPYPYTFSCFVKQRWLGRKIIDVFTNEFRNETPDQYRTMIQNGAVTVNGKTITEDYALRTSDFIENRLHRHENPVSAQPIDIIYEDDDMVVIDKPSSIPCHPCGRYHFNSIVFILGKEHNLPHLRNIYRLDRLTSGVLILGKTPLRTYQLEQNIVKREVEKEYICRVDGEFPTGITEVDQPLGCISQKLALFKVDPQGKESKTTFERLCSNGKTSVVKCLPVTGRTHQIRVHLQYLGHPIVNDPLYNTDAWGPHRGKGGQFEQTEEELINGILKTNNIGLWKVGDNPLFAEKIEAMAKAKLTAPEPVPSGNPAPLREESSSLGKDKEDNSVNLTKDLDSEICASDLSVVGTDEPSAKKPRLASQNDSDPCVEVRPSNTAVDLPGFDPDKWIPDAGCYACKTLYMDPRPKDLVMCLHAIRYKGPGWEFRTKLPDWATEDWSEND